MRNLFMLCILLGVLNSIKSDELKCQFNVDTDWPSNLWMYGCFVTGLEVKVSDQVFTSVSGIHLPNKNINDVKHLGIEDSKVLFMPQRLDRIFNLRSLLILGTSLVKVQSDDFIGLENLEFLHLGDNVLNYLPSDVFSRLTKVISITLIDNYIQELPKDIFKYNLQLEGLWIYGNNFKYISPTIFNHLTKLHIVSGKGVRHTCLNKHYSGIDKMQYLKEDVRYCANPNEILLTSIQNCCQHCF